VKLRPGTPNDIDELGRICYEAFTAIANEHNFPTDFENVQRATGLISMLIDRPDIYSVVAEIGGRLVASNFLWEVDTVAGLGPITVDVRLQNSSIGKLLMQDVIKRAEDRHALSTRLVQSAYHNRSLSLYTKFGFDAREPLSLMQGPSIKAEFENVAIRPMRLEDLTYIDELAITVHGHTRRGEVTNAIKQGTARVAERRGRITGYTTGIGFFGHSVALTNNDLKALISDAEVFSGAGFVLPTRNGELLRWALENGLRIVQPMTLMSKDFYKEPQGAFLPSILY
jgi:predicted N-acetyltransferase YhbS